MRIAPRGNKAALTVPLTTENLMILRATPSPYKFSGNVLVFDPTPDAIRHLRQHFGTASGFDNFNQDKIIESPNTIVPKDWSLDWEPYEHQKDAFKKSWNKSFYMYRMGVQTGKSALAILNAAWLVYKGHVDAVLIIAPSGVHKKWIDEEYAKFWPSCVPSCAAAWNQATKSDRMKFEDAVNTDKVSILSFNVEAFSAGAKKAEKVVEAWMKRHNVFLIMDESHLIKAPNAKRTRALFRLRKHAKFVRNLTGTAGQPFDYYSQYNFLNKAILGFSTYEAFKNHFGIMVDLHDKDGEIKRDRRGKAIKIVAVDEAGRKKYRNVQQLRNMVEPYTFTIQTEDCNDLPPQVYGTIQTKLTTEQRKYYEDIRNDLIVEFEGHEFSAPMAIQKMTRFRQIVGGFLPDEEGNPKPINKVNRRIEDMIEKIDILEDKPLIIWASYKAEIQAIAERLRQEYGATQVVTYYGGDDKKVREAGRERFQNNDARFFVSNPACGGIGFSLYVTNTMIFYSNSFDLKQRQQAEGRILAAAQTAKKCIFLDMLAEDTIDERVINALLNKFEIESQLTGRQALEWLTAGIKP